MLEAIFTLDQTATAPTFCSRMAREWHVLWPMIECAILWCARCANANSGESEHKKKIDTLIRISKITCKDTIKNFHGASRFQQIFDQWKKVENFFEL
jgi:hypothetical protein